MNEARLALISAVAGIHYRAMSLKPTSAVQAGIARDAKPKLAKKHREARGDAAAAISTAVLWASGKAIPPRAGHCRKQALRSSPQCGIRHREQRLANAR